MSRSSSHVVMLSAEEQAVLEMAGRRYTSPYCDVIRARIVLMAAAGLENAAIARRLDTPVQVVAKWRKRFCEEGVTGLKDRPRVARDQW
jgi:transposase